MTVYVDNADIPARVGSIQGVWCHLTADTPTELHELAQKIGLQRRWYQGKCSSAKRGHCDLLDGSCIHFHYDVTKSLRQKAVAAGATEIDIRQLGEIIRARRQHLRGKTST